MTFNPYKQIGNGSIKELLVVGADPNSNYKFNMTSSNRDGVSPVSNVVEWGAQINVPQTYWVGARVGMIRSTTLATPSQLPIGVWVCGVNRQEPMESYLELRHHAINWQGDSGTDLLNTYPISIPALFEQALDGMASLTLFPIVSGTDIPTTFISYQTATELRLIKFELLLSGAKFTAIPLEPLSGGVLPDNLIVMDDGLLLLHGGGNWFARQPSSGLSGYSVGNDTSLASSTATPYQQNSYPVSLRVIGGGEGGPLYTSYLSASPQARYVGGSVVVSESTPVAQPGSPTAEWNMNALTALVTPQGNIYWVSAGTSTPLGDIYAQSTGVLTNAVGFAGVLLYGEDLLIYGKNDSPEVLSAPGTINTDYPAQPNIVNIHRMDLTRDTGFGGTLNDIGPNALIIDPGEALATITANPEAFDMKPVWNVVPLAAETSEPVDFNGGLMALSDGSLVLRSAPVVPNTPFGVTLLPLNNGNPIARLQVVSPVALVTIPNEYGPTDIQYWWNWPDPNTELPGHSDSSSAPQMMFTDTISAQLSLEVTLVPTGEVLYTSTPILVDDHYRVYYSYSPVIGLDYDLGPPEVDWAPHPPDYRFVYQLPDPTIPSPSELVFVVNDPGNVYSLSVKSETLTARLLSNYNTVGFAGSAPSGDWFAIDDTTYPPDFVSALGVGQKWYRILYTAPATIYGSGIGINFNLTLTDTSTNASFDIPVHVYSQAL